MIKEYNILSKEEKVKVKEFLDKTKIDGIDNLLKNMLVLIDEEVVGIITYENFNKTSLIRYFIYKKQVSDLDAKNLLINLLKKIKLEQQIDCVIIVDNSFNNLLENLGFVKQEMLFLDENKIGIPKDLLIMKIIFDKETYF